MATKVLDCGCADNPNRLHMKTCPVWVNVGPDLRNRNYVRRETYDDGEQFPAHQTCAYSRCESMPDPASPDGLCWHHIGNDIAYEYAHTNEEW